MDTDIPMIKTIPRFYLNRQNLIQDENKRKLYEQARLSFLKRLGREIIDNYELQQLWAIFERRILSLSSSTLTSSILDDFNDHKIDYAEFRKIGEQLDANMKLRKYFNATVFAKLLPKADRSLGSNQSRIFIITFFKYLIRKIWLQQARISLSYWDSNGNGYLTEYDLKNYIRESIPTLVQLNDLDRSYYPFYVCVVVRKFFFFLDPNRHNRIKIIDILFSGFLDELLELRYECSDHQLQLQVQNQSNQNNFNNHTNSNHCQSSVSSPISWFSAANTCRLYNTYLALDEDGNGLISKTEFKKFGNFNEYFVEQLFNVRITYNQEIDFKTFIDIVLALENRKEIQSAYFFFQILDINQNNYLNDFVLRYFFKAIENQMRNQNQEPISFDDFSNEIYDMIRPKYPRHITFDDLIDSGYSDTIISILIDFNGFYAYENRDSNIQVRNDGVS
ncbi:fork head domain transcription factor slp2-like [Sarcoptes scabiei]|nr:fork head domain transcription factor slp2-like [Sarcoptes scabiei]